MSASKDWRYEIYIRDFDKNLGRYKLKLICRSPKLDEAKFLADAISRKRPDLWIYIADSELESRIGKCTTTNGISSIIIKIFKPNQREKKKDFRSQNAPLGFRKGRKGRKIGGGYHNPFIRTKGYTLDYKGKAQISSKFALDE